MASTLLSPEEAGRMGSMFSDYGETPMFTNKPEMANEPNSVYADMSPYESINNRPTDEDMDFTEKMHRFVKSFEPSLPDPNYEAQKAYRDFLQQNKPNVPFADEKITKDTYKMAEFIAAQTFGEVSKTRQGILKAAMDKFKNDYIGQSTPKTATQAFIQGFSEKYKRENPNATQDEINLAIADEQQKRDVTKSAAQGRARYEALGKYKIQAFYDNKTDSVVSMNADDFNKANSNEPGRFINASASPEQKEKLAKAGQRGGATTANVAAAVKMYKLEAPEIIELREKVKSKGLMPEEKFKDVGALNQWIDRKLNDPDAALLQKKTKFLADSLMRVIGGTQGGEWAFKVASDILDPSYSPETFANIVNSHGLAMERMAWARQDFGKDGTPPNAIPSGAVPIINKRTGERGYRVGNKLYDANGNEVK